MSVTETLAAIEAQMTAKGWDKGGVPHSVKRDKDGAQIAEWASPEFMHDLEDAKETVQAQQAVAELIQRAEA